MIVPLLKVIKEVKMLRPRLLEKSLRKSWVIKSVMISSHELMRLALEVVENSSKEHNRVEFVQLRLMSKGCNTMSCTGKMKD